MIYDPVNERVLMFGGSIYTNNYAFYNELWSFEPEDQTWTLVESGEKPAPRFHHTMVYIPDSHKVFLFGGWGTSDKIADTWVYDITENEWSQLHPSASPSPRSSTVMAYDHENNVVVLFSGYGEDDEKLTDTWVYDFSAEDWVQMHPDDEPLPQYGGGMIYDTDSKKLLLYPGHWSTSRTVHGYGDEVWVYDYPSNTWTELNTSPKPEGRYWFHHTYIDHEAAFLLNGGTGIRDEPCEEVLLYRYRDNSWETVTTNSGPVSRSSSSMCYIPGTLEVVLFGGADENVNQLGDTWLLDTQTWSWSRLGQETQSTDTVTDEPNTGIPGYQVPALVLGMILATLLVKHGKVHFSPRMPGGS